ncbi:glycoside hydrolase family 71/99-like protein [Aquimarina aquimarini]|uniref:glycoside hydrolase family 71/99-like protein n=1 Tax=Aquimarina aquimarini TaxID=1191734 RepID=UPI000D56107E|nr:glycoside hydrolase family 71/99-like protein [Aquimarina aquimarini]
MLRTSSKIIFLLLSTVILFYSCEEEEDLLITEPQTDERSAAETVQDTVYSDAELLKVLEEEFDFLEQEKKGNISDISSMDIVKENPKKVYVHYLPWFQSKDFDGYWGQHWTMSNQNPDVPKSNGNLQIASHYYPLIGPYSSNDPDLHEYHFLMMKLSGIDGVIFDWYGSKDLHDYGLIKQSTETFITALEDLGLQFSIMYEDRVAAQVAEQSATTSIIEAAQDDFTYINQKYFPSPQYMKHNNNNMLFVFGPHHITTETSWNQVFDILPTSNRPDFLTLWAASNTVGVNATGEFLWVDQDHLLAHEHYYNTHQTTDQIIVGSAYPGFNSFYNEGGWTGGTDSWTIDLNNGTTFIETLNYNHHERSDFIQIITWNDFGEGTMIEPTQEFGFTYLQLLQQYTGVPHTSDDLQVALDLYLARKEYTNNEQAQRLLDRTYKYIKQLDMNRADKIIKSIQRFL